MATIPIIPGDTKKRSRLFSASTRGTAPVTLNEDERSVEMTFSTGAPVQRSGYAPDGAWGTYVEELSLDPRHVDLSRLQAGAPLLNSHNSFNVGDVLGVIETASVDGTRGTCTVRFSERAEVEPIFKDVASGVLRNVSVGYAVSKWKEITRKTDAIKRFLAVRWTPLEVSLVPIPADKNSQIRSYSKDSNMHDDDLDLDDAPDDTKEREMADPVIAERERVSAIRDMANDYGISRDFADDLINRGTDTAVAYRLMAKERANNSSKIGQRPAYDVTGARGDSFTLDNPADQREAMASALLARCYPQSKDIHPSARAYMGASLTDLARELTPRRSGEPRFNRDLGGLMSNSDFALVLSNATNKILLESYKVDEVPLRKVSAERQLKDFKQATMIRVGQVGSLQQVGEGGEFRRMSFDEAGESLKLKTYGGIVGLTRQAIINDDLAILMTSAQEFASACRSFESDQLAIAILSNPTLVSDNIAIFHSNHANVATGAVLSVASLGAARAMMRQQKNLGGTSPIGLNPQFLVVGSQNETLAEQLLTQISAAKSSDVNPLAGKLELIVEPRLDTGVVYNNVTYAGNPNAWYLFAGLGNPALNRAYLGSSAQPFTDMRVGFDVDGIEYKCRLDFAVGWSDFRPVLRNLGQ